MLDKVYMDIETCAGTTATTVPTYYIPWTNLAPSVGAQECKPMPPTNKNKKETDMRTYNNTPVVIDMDVRTSKEDSLAADTRQYLRDRLSDVTEDKTTDLAKAFFIYDDDPPTTPDEMIQRIKDGKFTVPSKEEQAKAKTWYNCWYGIKWRDPSKLADKTGYEAALEKMRKARTLVKDAIMVKSAEEALKALNEFEATDFSK